MYETKKNEGDAPKTQDAPHEADIERYSSRSPKS